MPKLNVSNPSPLILSLSKPVLSFAEGCAERVLINQNHVLGGCRRRLRGHRPGKWLRIDLFTPPPHPPMQMRPSRTSGFANRTDKLTLNDAVAEPNRNPRKVEKGAVKAHAVINHQQIAFKRERTGSRQNHHTVGRRNHGRACAACHINPAVGGAGCS